MAGTAQETIDRALIAATEARIRPYIRQTPVIEVDGADIGLDGSVRLTFKLESPSPGDTSIASCWSPTRPSCGRGGRSGAR